jgi:hypothetical protein
MPKLHARPTIPELTELADLIDRLLEEAHAPRPRLHVPPRAVDTLQALMVRELARRRPGPPSVATRLHRIGKRFAS